MLTLAIPGWDTFRWSELVLDINGTLTGDGILLPGVAESLAALASQLTVHLLTADTRGTAGTLADRLGVCWARVEPGQETEQKQAYVLTLGADRVIAIGNGNNDAMMLSAASLGIAVLGPEGGATRAMLAADVMTRDIAEALGLLTHPTRLLSTLRC